MGAIVVVALGVAWVVASYLLMARAPTFAWNGVVIIGPMLASLAWLGLRRRWTVLALGALAALLALVWVALHGGGVSLETLYLAQHVGVHVVLAVVFAQSLYGGRESLITMLARRVHAGRLTPDMRTYSRHVTVAWTVYFVAMAALSIVIFVLAPMPVWAAFANFATPLSLAVFFVGEHILRYLLHPEFERTTLRHAMQAWKRRDTPEGIA